MPYFDYNKKYSFENELTICIPFYYENDNRLRNILKVIQWLNLWLCDFTILIGNVGTPNDELEALSNEYNTVKILNVNYNDYMKPNDIFHRTKLLNYLYQNSDTKVIANYDCDVVFNPWQLTDAFEYCFNQDADVVYPFLNKVFEVETRFFYWDEDCNNPCVGDMVIPHCKYRGENEYMIHSEKIDWDSYGSCIFMRKDSVEKSGGENEKFIGWGWEDHERYHRFNILNFNIVFIDGCVYHLTHPRSENSSKKNPFYENNTKEYTRICSIKTKKAMDKEIKTWLWIKNRKKN